MSAIDTMSTERSAFHGPMPSFAGAILKTLWARYRAQRELRRTRVHLYELSDGELLDIGLTRALADREAARSLLACYMNNGR